MTDPYVEQRDGGYYVRGSRVSLDSIVYAFRGGDAPETIVQCFPVLRLDQAVSGRYGPQREDRQV
jgi:uncharacterized protein (DUF433 family)